MNIDTLEQDPCNTCGYEEGSIYCKEHCPHEAKIEQEPCEDTISRKQAIYVASGYCHPANVAKELAKLPSVNPQLCEDAISRQAVIDYIHRIFNQGTGKKKSFEFIQKYVEKLPSVTPQEPKTGRWEWLTENKYRCSNCKHETRVDECMSEPMYDFCPFCRARMESEDKK